MRAFAIFPKADVFDGSGSLSETASAAIAAVARVVGGCLMQGDEDSLQAHTWEGPLVEQGTRPSVSSIADRFTLEALVRRCLDPNDHFGGEVRSAHNCRMVTFGFDGQAFICLRHDDTPPQSPEQSLVTIEEHSEWLTQTDWFDGPWPHR